MADQKRICAIPNCGKKVQSRGWCAKHYMRWWTHGDPQQTLLPRGREDAFIANVALPFTDKESCLIWPFERSTRGYPRHRLDGKRVAAGRVVCEAAHGPAPSAKHHCAHLCGKGHEGCVNPHHLSWKLPAENEADKITHGTTLRGRRNHKTRLNEAEVLEIYSLADRVPRLAVAEKFKISRRSVCDIQLGRSWAWLTKETQ